MDFVYGLGVILSGLVLTCIGFGIHHIYGAIINTIEDKGEEKWYWKLGGWTFSSAPAPNILAMYGTIIIIAALLIGIVCLIGWIPSLIFGG